MRFTTWSAVLLAMAISLPASSSCSKVESNKSAADALVAEHERSLAELDIQIKQLHFTSALDESRIILPESAEFSSRFGPAFTQKLTARISSDGDRRILGVKVLPGGVQFETGETISKVLGFYSRNGRLPQDGLELLDLQTKAEKEEFLRLSRMEQLNLCYAAVNPLSGILYESFADDTWRAGGVSLEILPNEEVQYSERIRIAAPPEGSINCRYRVFGDRDGEILLEDEARLTSVSDVREVPSGSSPSTK